MTLTDARGILAANVKYWDNRLKYQQDTGEQAPPFDSKKPGGIKTWRMDSAALMDKSVTYQTLGKNAQGNPAVVPVTIPADLAGQVNFPGAYVYPKYEDWKSTKPATAIRYTQFLGRFPNPIPRELLMLPEEAAQLAAEIGNGATAQEEPGEHSYPDRNRVFNIVVNGIAYAAGFLLMSRAGEGLGSPGHWVVGSNAGPKWVSEHPATGEAVTDMVPIPVRALLPNERLIVGLTGLVQVQVGDAPVPAGGGLTADQAAMLKAIYDRVLQAVPTK